MCCGSSKPMSGKSTKCPNCQRKITEIRDIKLKKCPFCSAELPTKEKATQYSIF
ncbi:hypothetical protein SPSIL_038740 [Sporomusa silvacetica DSM 10669]|uniref:Double zinc ribbon n=1 Tax=Sporomusa silvacetica DSM 10669 TaxID=1123289 RepID=A0ABZ3IPR9_9FIRM|nr:hypothetical protein SPSIL_02170 [Sporomusa silvacetica DSM 10669]